MSDDNVESVIPSTEPIYDRVYNAMLDLGVEVVFVSAEEIARTVAAEFEQRAWVEDDQSWSLNLPIEGGKSLWGLRKEDP